MTKQNAKKSVQNYLKDEVLGVYPMLSQIEIINLDKDGGAFRLKDDAKERIWSFRVQEFITDIEPSNTEA